MYRVTDIKVDVKCKIFRDVILLLVDTHICYLTNLRFDEGQKNFCVHSFGDRRTVNGTRDDNWSLSYVSFFTKKSCV